MGLFKLRNEKIMQYLRIFLAFLIVPGFGAYTYIYFQSGLSGLENKYLVSLVLIFFYWINFLFIFPLYLFLKKTFVVKGMLSHVVWGLCLSILFLLVLSFMGGTKNSFFAEAIYFSIIGGASGFIFWVIVELKFSDSKNLSVG